MKRLLIGTVSAMLMALPLYANVATSSPNLGSELDAGNAQMMEESATPAVGSEKQKMEEIPTDAPAAETTPTDDQQKMEEDSAIESDSSPNEIEMQEDTETESEM